MIDYRTAYDLILELQEQLEQDHNDHELGRPDYRKIQALSATYTLQEYLVNTIAELEACGALESEEEGETEEFRQLMDTLEEDLSNY